MTLLNEIKAICSQIGGYSFEYEDVRMMNVKADDKVFPCIFFEEYREGMYSSEKFFKTKSTRVQIYFMKLCEMHNTAEERERLREEIETEAVFPFMRLYENKFGKVQAWRFFTPLPRFDANEVSIMLMFDFKQNLC